MSDDITLEKPPGKVADTHTFDNTIKTSTSSSLPDKHPRESHSTHRSAQHTAQPQPKEKKRLLNSPAQLSERQEMIRIISNRLFVALFSLMTISAIGGYLTWSGHELSAGATNWMVILCGAIGGFISLQRRLKTLVQDDLLLLARSWVYVLLSPLVGGILALLLYFLFIAGLLQGDLFPNFNTIQVSGLAPALATSLATENPSQTGLAILFQVQGVGYKDYAKLVFWCFVAGYSESFVTNIISNFESTADQSISSKS